MGFMARTIAPGDTLAKVFSPRFRGPAGVPDAYRKLRFDVTTSFGNNGFL